MGALAHRNRRPGTKWAPGSRGSRGAARALLSVGVSRRLCETLAQDIDSGRPRVAFVHRGAELDSTLTGPRWEKRAENSGWSRESLPETYNCRCVKHGCHPLIDGRRPEDRLRLRDPASSSRLAAPGPFGAFGA